jgi:hypothetical protein
MPMLETVKENINKNASCAINNLTEKTTEMGKKAKESFEEGSKDWLQYVKAHPFQTMLYGMVVYFSFKGLFK